MSLTGLELAADSVALSECPRMRRRECVYLVFNLLLLTFCSVGIAQFAAFFPLYVSQLGIRQEMVAPIFSVCPGPPGGV